MDAVTNASVSKADDDGYYGAEEAWYKLHALALAWVCVILHEESVTQPAFQLSFYH